VSRIEVRPLLLRTIALLVLVNATAGIIVIVAGSGQVGSTEAHVLETTAFLSLAALLLLPCVLAFDAGRPEAFPYLPQVAAACLVVGFALAVYLVWDDPRGDTLTKVSASFAVAGGGMAHVCLLSLLRLRRHHVWLQVFASRLTLVLATLLINAFWTIPVEGGLEDWKVRLFVVVAILTAATSLLAALVERLSGSRSEPQEAAKRAAYCPNCGAALPEAQFRCAVCGAQFRIEFLDA
jgi:hypothetical protein